MMTNGNRFESRHPSVKPRDAKRYGDELNRLTEKYGRRLKVEEVILEARNPRSPLHSYYDWDIRSAARKHWVAQTRQLLSIVYVDVVDDRGRSVPARAWRSVRVQEGGRPVHAYVKTDNAMNTPEYKAQLVSGALDELEGWCRRYQPQLFPELKELVHEISVLARLHRRAIFKEVAPRAKRREAVAAR